MDSITIGGPALEQSAFIYIAEDQGYFARNGLNVTIRDDYPSGVAPVSDMVSGKLDISVSAEYPVIAQVFNQKDISIIGVIDKYQNEELIGRRDRGIENVSDLEGQKGRFAQEDNMRILPGPIPQPARHEPAGRRSRGPPGVSICGCRNQWQR